jgi:hypothetical protein
VLVAEDVIAARLKAVRDDAPKRDEREMRDLLRERARGRESAVEGQAPIMISSTRRR